MNSVAVVVPNWNGEDLLKECIDSLLAQSLKNILIIVVENGSIDSSMTILNSYKKRIVVLPQKKNLGFTGGVNVGIRYAMEQGVDYITLFNNDAIAEKDWLKQLCAALDKHEDAGIVTSKILIQRTGRLDSTGDWYTTTGLPFPRGRDEVDKGQYDDKQIVFGASGGASMYRASLFQDIGIFDEDFFAYYEDVDVSFRAQLKGWKVRYEPAAIVYHKLSATSSKLGNFTIRQSAKNFLLVAIKDLPLSLLVKFSPQIIYRYARMFAARLIKGGAIDFLKGFFQALALLPKKLAERRSIQKNRTVSVAYIESIIYKGKPPLVEKTK